MLKYKNYVMWMQANKNWNEGIYQTLSKNERDITEV